MVIDYPQKIIGFTDWDNRKRTVNLYHIELFFSASKLDSFFSFCPND